MRYAAALLFLALAGCKGLVTISQDTDVTVAGPSTASPAPAASPSAGSCVPAAAVRVGFFSISCGAGATPPQNGAGVLPVGCDGAVTATPKERDGSNQDAALHVGTVPRWTVATGSAYLSLVTAENPFNADVRWVATTPVGTRARVEVTVCGVTGGFEFQAQ